MKKYIYRVIHVYLVDNEYSEIKDIGIYSSEEKANQAIDASIRLPGFRDYPRDCYKIKRYEVDDFTEWLNGCDESKFTLLN